MATLDDLVRWAEDEGALDMLMSVDEAGGCITVALPLLEDPSDDPRDNFRRTSERYKPFTMRAEGGAVAIDGEFAVPVAISSASVAQEGEAFGLELQVGDARVRAIGSAWSITSGPDIVLPVTAAADPWTITFHGPGPLTSESLRQATEAHGVRVSLFGNWNGSGQSFGAAFVRHILEPAHVQGDEQLPGAWRIVPAGAGALDPRGVWLVGNSLPSAAYATLQRSSQSDPALVRAVAEALVSLPSLDWAHSGNTLIEGADALRAWCEQMSLP